ncbi:MAG TPA: hypothetical protein VK752_31140, partial [Bryobacteraceae bacterium]|nr:hypothetical protein [Bryobacteraceae bacterium]
MPIRLFFLSALLSSGATLTISCVDPLDIATLTWSGATVPVQIIVGSPTGTPMTGLLPASGTAVTGPWVSDNLKFYLEDQSGNVEASVTANLYCANLPPAVDQGLASGSYFPLAIGNTWVYKYNDRLVTASYVVRTIAQQTYQAGQIYYILTQTSPPDPTPIAMLRADASGVVYQLTSTGEQVLLDPKSAAPAAYQGALGIFNDALTPPAQVAGGLIQTTTTYARGIGLIASQSTMLTGSSGGFTESLDLVDVKVDG